MRKERWSCRTRDGAVKPLASSAVLVIHPTYPARMRTHVIDSTSQLLPRRCPPQQTLVKSFEVTELPGARRAAIGEASVQSGRYWGSRMESLVRATGAVDGFASGGRETSAAHSRFSPHYQQAASGEPAMIKQQTPTDQPAHPSIHPPITQSALPSLYRASSGSSRVQMT